MSSSSISSHSTSSVLSANSLSFINHSLVCTPDSNYKHSDPRHAHDARYQKIFDTMLESTPLSADLATLCTNFTEAMESDTENTIKGVRHSLYFQENIPIINAARDLPDGALNSFFLMLGEARVSTEGVIDCLIESIKAKKIENIRFLFNKESFFLIHDGKKITMLDLFDAKRFSRNGGNYNWQSLSCILDLRKKDIASSQTENGSKINKNKSPAPRANHKWWDILGIFDPDEKNRAEHLRGNDAGINKRKSMPTNRFILSFNLDCRILPCIFALGDKTIADYLIENGVAIDERIIFFAILSSNLELVKSLLNLVSTDSPHLKLAALHAAVGSGSIEMLNYVIDKFNINLKENINSYLDGYPLFSSIIKNFLFKGDRCSMIDHLVAYGADLKIKDKENNTIFHFAAENNDIELLKHIRSILPNASMDEINLHGKTPLAVAISKNNFQVVEYIIENGNISPEHIAKAIEQASTNNYHTKILKYLVNRFPSVYTRDLDGDSPVDNMAHIGDLELVKFLVSKGHAINARTLGCAARSHNLELVKYLVESGVSPKDIDLKNCSKETAEYLKTQQQKMQSWTNFILEKITTIITGFFRIFISVIKFTLSFFSTTEE